MTRPIQRRPILRRCDRAILFGTVAALVIAVLVSPALATTSTSHCDGAAVAVRDCHLQSELCLDL